MATIDVSVWQKIYRWASDPSYQLAFVIVGAFVTYSPIYCGITSNMEDSDLRESLASSQFRESSFAILGLALTHIIDSIVDLFSLTTRLLTLQKKNRQQADGNDISKSVITEIEKWTFSIGVVLVPIIALFPSSTPRLALVYCCATRSQILLMGGYVIIGSSSRYPKYFPLITVWIMIIACWLPIVAAPWILNVSREVTLLRDLIFYVEFAGIALYFVCALRWLFYEFVVKLLAPTLHLMLIEAWRSSSYRNGEDADGVAVIAAANAAAAGMMRMKHSESSVYFPAAYVIVSLTWTLFTAFVYSLLTNFYDTTEKDLLLLNVPILIFQITMMMLSYQFAKFEVVEHLYALLDSKKSYVRYISHELR